MKALDAAAIAAPSIGPAVVRLAGFDVPVLSMALALSGLLLARAIAPPPLRKLSSPQHWALTALLLLITAVIVMGFITGQPLRPGMATIVGVGLGFSGIVAIELIADRGMSAVRAFFTGKTDGPSS